MLYLSKTCNRYRIIFFELPTLGLFRDRSHIKWGRAHKHSFLIKLSAKVSSNSTRLTTNWSKYISKDNLIFNTKLRLRSSLIVSTLAKFFPQWDPQMIPSLPPSGLIAHLGASLRSCILFSVSYWIHFNLFDSLQCSKVLLEDQVESWMVWSDSISIGCCGINDLWSSSDDGLCLNWPFHMALFAAE